MERKKYNCERIKNRNQINSTDIFLTFKDKLLRHHLYKLRTQMHMNLLETV